VSDAKSGFAYSVTLGNQDISRNSSAMAKNDAEKPISGDFAEGRELRPLTHFVFHSNSTPEEETKAD